MNTSHEIIKKLDPFFNPRSIAVIGATNNSNKWGFSTITSALDGFKGPVYPVNLWEKEVVGLKAYKRVKDIPQEQPVDLAIIVIPSTGVARVMEDCVEKGVKACVIISAGFAEIGEDGRALQDEVVAIARKGDIRIVGPNCMGLWSATSELRAFMFPLRVKAGPIAFVSQGGNVGGAIVGSAYDRGVGFQRYVSCGCTADVQIEDYIEHFGLDPEVKVILAYIEGLNDGQRFIEKVKKVTMKKPVIIIKPGKTDAAAKAISSHSGALAGSDILYDVVFKKAGIIRAETSEELLDYTLGFLLQPLPENNRVVIVTPGGSYGVLCADACAILNLDVIDLPTETITEFDKIFPPRWSRGNPVDPAGDRDFPAYFKAAEMLLELDETDAIFFMGFGDISGVPDDFAEHMESFKDGNGNYDTFTQALLNIGSQFPKLIHGWIKKYKKPVLTTTFTQETPSLEGGVLHPYPSPVRAAKVLAALYEYKVYLEKEGHYKDKPFDPMEFWWLNNK